MKLKVFKSQIDGNAARFLKKAGYTFIRSYHTGKESYVRPLGRYNYPRFHIYIIEEGDKITFHLHLDQKQPSYNGANAHNAEYEGETVKNEIYRLASLIT